MKHLPTAYLKTIFVDRGAHPAYDISLAATAAEAWFQLAISGYAIGDNSMRQLNRCVTDFLTTKFDYFWIQGNDTDWKGRYIAHMLAQELPIVGGLVPVKATAVTTWMYNDLHPAAEMDQRTAVQRVAKVGLESIIIHRDVFVKYQKEFPEQMYHNDFAGPDHGKPEWNYFGWCIEEDPPGSGFRRLLSEDYRLCFDAAKMGFPVHIDRSDYCGHWDHRTRFPLKDPESLPTQTAQQAPRPQMEPARLELEQAEQPQPTEQRAIA